MTPPAPPATMQFAQSWLDGLAGFGAKLLFKACVWGIGGALAGLLLAIIVMVVIHRARLLRRIPRWWNILVKLSYAIVLSALVFAGGVAGASHGVQRVIDEAVDTHVQASLASVMPPLRQFLATSLMPMAKETVIGARDLVEPLARDLSYKPQTSSSADRYIAHVINDIVIENGAEAMASAFQGALRVLPGLIPSTGDAQGDAAVRFTVGTALKVLAASADTADFSPLDASVPQAFAHAVRHQIDNFFEGLYIGLAIKLLLVAALVGGEMLLYFLVWLPRHRPVIPEAGAA